MECENCGKPMGDVGDGRLACTNAYCRWGDAAKSIEDWEKSRKLPNRLVSCDDCVAGDALRNAYLGFDVRPTRCKGCYPYNYTAKVSNKLRILFEPADIEKAKRLEADIPECPQCGKKNYSPNFVCDSCWLAGSRKQEG